MDEDRNDTLRRPSRRGVVGTLGAGLFSTVAGCTGGEIPRRSPETELVSGTLRIPPGAYETTGFSLDGERWLTVSANLSDRSVDIKRDGPAVDVFVMAPDDDARYRRGEPFQYLQGVSMPDVVNGDVSATVPAGEYEVVVDNTNRGSGAPGGSNVDAVVDLDVTAEADREGGSGDGRGAIRPGGLTE